VKDVLEVVLPARCGYGTGCVHRRRLDVAEGIACCTRRPLTWGDGDGDRPTGGDTGAPQGPDTFRISEGPGPPCPGARFRHRGAVPAGRRELRHHRSSVRPLTKRRGAPVKGSVNSSDRASSCNGRSNPPEVRAGGPDVGGPAEALPYSGSHAIGAPRDDRCTRIWCVLPVTGRTRSRTCGPPGTRSTAVSAFTAPCDSYARCTPRSLTIRLRTTVGSGASAAVYDT